MMTSAKLPVGEGRSLFERFPESAYFSATSIP
jgi:hypothetical protein